MYHIIINPASRSGKGKQIWNKLIEPMLQREDIPYRRYFSEKAGDVPRIVEKIFSQPPQGEALSLVILGGDGTMNEVLQKIPLSPQVVLGYIPTGSSNDLARDLGIPTDPAEALDLILHSGRPRPMDLGTVTYPGGETRRFAVSCGIGFDAAVCQEAMNSKIKKLMNKLGLGKLTYLGIALRQLLAAKAISGRLTLDEGKPVDIGNMLFTACMLHRFEGGGFMFAPDADANDGILDLCAVGDLSKALILVALPTAFKGKHFRFKGVTPYKAEKITIETSSPLWVHTDGEVTRKSRRICVACQKNAIKILVNDPENLKVF